MTPSLVTDELSGDFETAFEIGREWGVDRFELRGIYDMRVPRLTPYARRRLVRAVQEFGVRVTALSPGLFKCPWPEADHRRSNLGWMEAGYFRAWSDARALVEDHLQNLLPASIDLAGELSCPFIIAFGFHRAGAPGGVAPEPAVEALARAAERAGAAGLDLLIETEEGFWADTGERSAAMVQRIGSPRVAVNWDPANALIEGDVPFPSGYEAVRHLVRNVHFKDVRRHADGSWEIVADGDVDWSGQIAALAAADYAGSIAVEPHLSPAVASARSALARLRALIGAVRPPP